VLERGNHLSFSQEEEGGGWGQPSSPPSFFLFWWIRPPTRNNVTLPLFLDGEDAREDMRERSTLDSFLKDMESLEEKTGRELHKMLWERGVEFREVGEDGSLVSEKIGSTSYNVLLTPSRSRSLLQDYLELVKHALDLGNTLSPTPPDDIPRHFLSRYGRNNRGGSLFSERGDRTLFLRYLSKMMTYAEQSFPRETTTNLVIAWDSAPQHGKVSVGERKRSFIHTWAEKNLLAHKKPIKGVVFLPVRQPDFNPAELLFAFVKSTIRRRSKNAEGELSVKETVRMIDSAMMDVTESMVKGWVRYGCYQIPGEDWSAGIGRKKMCGYDSDFMFLKRAAVEKWEKEKERLPPLVKNDLLSGDNLSHLSRFRTEEEARKVGFRVKEGKIWREGRVDEKKEDENVTGKKIIVSHDTVLQKDGNETLVPNLKLLPSEENASHTDPPFPSSYSLLLDLLLDVGRASSFLSPPPQKERIDSFLSSLNLSHLRRASSLSVDMASVFSSFFEKPPSSSSDLILDSMERVLSNRDASKRVTLRFLSPSFSGDKQEVEVSVQKDTDTPFSSGGRSFLTFSSLSPLPFEEGSQRVALGRIKSVGDAHFLVSLSPGNGEMRLSNMRVCDLFPSLPPKKVSFVSRILSLTAYKHSIPSSSSSSPPSLLSLSTILVSVLSYDYEKKEAMRKKESLAEKVGLVLRSSSTWSEVSSFCEKEGAEKRHPPLFDVHMLREKRRAERKLLSLSSKKGREREEGERRWPGYPITEGEYHEEVGKVPPPVPKEVKSVFSVRLSEGTEEGYEVHISFSGGEAEEVMRLGKDEKPLSEQDRNTYEQYFNEMSEENVSKLLLSIRRVDERRVSGAEPTDSSNLLLSTGRGGFKFREEETIVPLENLSPFVLLFDKEDSSLLLHYNQTFSYVSSDETGSRWDVYTKERDGYRRLKEGGRFVRGSLSFLKSSYGLTLKRRKVSEFSRLRLKRISSGSYFSTQSFVPESGVDLTFPSASLGEDKIYLKKGGSGWCVFREGKYYDVFSKKDIQSWCDSHLPDDDFDALSTFTTSSSQEGEEDTIIRLALNSTTGGG
jgi:hypothetical protein